MNNNDKYYLNTDTCQRWFKPQESKIDNSIINSYCSGYCGDTKIMYRRMLDKFGKNSPEKNNWSLLPCYTRVVFKNKKGIVYDAKVRVYPCDPFISLAGEKFLGDLIKKANKKRVGGSPIKILVEHYVLT